MLQGSDGTTAGRVSSSRSRTSDEPHIGKYKLLKTIGKGNFAKVKLAKHVPTGKEVRTRTYDSWLLIPNFILRWQENGDRVTPLIYTKYILTIQISKYSNRLRICLEGK